ncbi:hypothetical protein [Nonomuraea ceibae]|uniref:hypothetical protein n=1 Tax=Nonomuraea ceibae TaxID=1935170 RepID=UPI001C5F5956|nr:hypothetical protein [Nonomuraea ceibae]
MPIDHRDLYELLEERSRPALDRPIPWERLRARAPAARRRRAAVVAVAGVVAASVVASVAVGWSLLGVRPAPEKEGTITASAPKQLPARFEAADGTVYRRLATVTLDAPAARTVSAKVPVSGKPLAVMADCPPSTPFYVPTVTAKVAGTRRWFPLTFDGLHGSCEQNRPADLAPLPGGAREVTFTMTMGKAAKDVPGRPGRWRFGIYEWTPPASPAPAPTETPPATIGDRYRLLTARTVTWPDSHGVTLTLPPTDRPLTVVAYCTGAIAGRVHAETSVNGRPPKGAARCWEPPSGGTFSVGELGTVRPGADGKVTVRLRVSAGGATAYERRPGTLTLAVYQTTE